MSDEEEYEYGILDDGFTGVFEEEDLSFLDEQRNMPSIDTHALIEELIASGVKKKQSEIIIKVISQEADRLVPKTAQSLILVILDPT